MIMLNCYPSSFCIDCEVKLRSWEILADSRILFHEEIEETVTKFSAYQ